MPEQVRDEAGACANAVHGFGSFLCDLIEYEGPTHVVCAFDESLTTSFRHELYPDYKANRPPPPSGVGAPVRGLLARWPRPWGGDAGQPPLRGG
ncbi:MAG: hypothetical protein U5L11_13960 [Arhodomonas sp.]|nr:hypothetical protein [Arhodomonas sp.]